MIEADGMADLMRKGIAEVMTPRRPSKPIFHGCFGLRQMSELEMTFLSPVPGFKATLVKARPNG
jgi:hypothetical protein